MMTLYKFKNGEYHYGAIAKWLHWCIAVLFLLAYISVYYRQWFTHEKTPENWAALQLHLSFGISIGALVVLRVIWKTLDQSPQLEPGTLLEHLLAKMGHYALYAIMILMPATGYLGTGVKTDFFWLVELPKFSDTKIYEWLVVDFYSSNFESIEPVVDYIHKDILGRWLVWLLILGHVLAAMYHHFVKKDDTLKRML